MLYDGLVVLVSIEVVVETLLREKLHEGGFEDLSVLFHTA